MMIFRNQICAFLNLSSAVLLIVFGMLSSNCMATDSTKLKITFDEFDGDHGPYYNDKIQMDNFYWVNENFLQNNDEYNSYSQSGIKSHPNFAFNNAPHATISCPGGSFDIISMCITDSSGDAQAELSFNGTLAHDDEGGISIEYEQGEVKFPDPFAMKCLDFNRGFRDLSSVTISTVYDDDGNGNWWWRNVGFDDIKLRINRACNVDSPTNVASSHRQPSFRIKNEILSGQTDRSP